MIIRQSYRVLILASALAYAPAAGAEPPAFSVGVQVPPLFACAAHADCMLVTGTCGAPKAVNRSRQDEAEAYFREVNMRVDCQRPLEPYPPQVAVCDAGRCNEKNSVGRKVEHDPRY